MSNFDQIAPMTGTLERKWDEVILTGEVYRCKVHPKQLKAQDNAYDVSLKLSKESFKMLKGLRLEHTDKNGNVNQVPLTGLKQVKLKKRDEAGELVLDEMDESIMEFSHCQITVRQNCKINGKDVFIPVNMVEDGSAVDKFLNEGSKVSVLVSAYQTVFQDKPAMGLNLKSVKVHEAVVYDGGSTGGGSGGGSGVDPWAALGMTSSEVPSFDMPAAGGDQPAQEPVQNQPTQGGVEEFEDDIPF